MICEKHNEEKKLLNNGRRCCVSCNKEHQRLWWQKNKHKQQQKVKANRNRLKDFVLELKNKYNCLICGENNPLVLDFDHLENKLTDVSRMIKIGTKQENILEEINKCRVLCSNCHRIKTHIENDTYIYKKLSTQEQYKEIFAKIKEMILSSKTNI